MAPATDLLTMNGISTPILTPPDVDDDFQTELSFVDMNDNIHAFLSQSHDSLEESRRLLQNHRGNQEAVKLNAISVGRIAAENLRRIRAIMQSPTILDVQCIDEFKKLHDEWLSLLEAHKIPSEDTLNADQVSEVMALFRELQHCYNSFGLTCRQPDSKFVSNASLDELGKLLQKRKESFLELHALHEKLKHAVSQFSELQPYLERVNTNINALRRSVANLEHLYQVHDIRDSLKTLHTRLDDIVSSINHLSNGSISGQLSNHKMESQLRRIDFELTDCQSRMSSLETVCNQIIDYLQKPTSKLDPNADPDEVECLKKFVDQYNETKSELGNMKTRFDDLMKNFPSDYLSRPSSQLNDDSYSDSSVSKLSTSDLKLRRRRRSSGTPSTDLNENNAIISNGQPSTSSGVDQSSRLTTRISSSIRQSPTMKTLLSCIILMGMGLFLLYMTSDDEIFSRSGHWRFKFGPQLRYVNGPPPI